jgi:hypothetical protein
MSVSFLFIQKLREKIKAYLFLSSGCLAHLIMDRRKIRTEKMYFWFRCSDLYTGESRKLFNFLWCQKNVRREYSDYRMLSSYWKVPENLFVLTVEDFEIPKSNYL